jgi:transcriptional regulator of arginine metabolism
MYNYATQSHHTVIGSSYAMKKAARHLTVKEILATKRIASQNQLRRELKRRGHTVTQATLSRDLRTLGITRVSDDRGFHYAFSTELARRDTRLINEKDIVALKHNEHLIVIATLPGCANAVAQSIDAQRYVDILGTVAGDDTILVIPTSADKISSLKRYLRTLITGI